MSDDSDAKKTSNHPWPETYPAWLIEILESSIIETGMSREEAEDSLSFEMQ